MRVNDLSKRNQLIKSLIGFRLELKLAKGADTTKEI